MGTREMLNDMVDTKILEVVDRGGDGAGLVRIGLLNVSTVVN